MNSERKQIRIAQKRSQILEAAADLFAEKGFHRTTTRDIARAVGVSEGTLYNYFENKEDLLMAIMSKLVEDQQLENRLSVYFMNDPRDLLVTIFNERREFVNQNRAMLQSTLSEILVNPALRQRYYLEMIMPVIQLLEEHLFSRIADDQLKKMDVKYLSRFVISIFLGLYLLEVVGDPLVEDQWDQLTNTIATSIFQGVEK